MSKKKIRPSVTVTLSTFDNVVPVYRAIRIAVPIADFKPVTNAEYHPRGGTPLRDATAAFIAHLDALRAPGSVTVGLLADESGSMGGREMGVIQGLNEFVDSMREVSKVDPKAAGKVLAVIVTDGLENSSREITEDALRTIIAEKEADGWTFIYLGANQDAWAASTDYGFSGTASGQSVTMDESSPRAFAQALKTTGTTHASQYLANQGEYIATASASSNRTISEAGIETTRPPIEPIIPEPPKPDPKVTSYGDIESASKAASDALSS